MSDEKHVRLSFQVNNPLPPAAQRLHPIQHHNLQQQQRQSIQQHPMHQHQHQPPEELSLAALSKKMIELQNEVDRLKQERSGRPSVKESTSSKKRSSVLDEKTVVVIEKSPRGISFHPKDGKEDLKYTFHQKEEHVIHNESACAWLPLPKSTNGQSIRWFLKSPKLSFESVKLGSIWLTAVILGVMLQVYVLRCLWVSLPDMAGNPHFCHNRQIGRPLQLCAVGIFLLSVGEAFNDIFLELLIVVRSKRKCMKALDEKKVQEHFEEMYTRPDGELVMVLDLTVDYRAKALCLMIVLVEAAVWVVVVVVGIKYLLSASTVSDLVQSAVAIVFVNDIDNLAHQAIAPFTYVENLDNEEYEVNWLAPNIGVKKPDEDKKKPKKSDEDKNELEADIIPEKKEPKNEKPKYSEVLRLQKGFEAISLKGTVPLFVVVSACVVYGLHATCC